MSVTIDPEDREFLARLEAKLDSDDLILMQKYLKRKIDSILRCDCGRLKTIPRDCSICANDE